MQFIATVTHSPDNCWARPENEEKSREWIEGMHTNAEETGVQLHGAFVAPNEHTFYFLMEAETFEAVTEFLGPPLLQDHDGHVVPVLGLSEVDDVIERQ